MGYLQSVAKNWKDRKIALDFYDSISRLAKVERRSSLPSTHMALVPFDLGEDDLEDGMILHFRGSSSELPSRALAGLLLLKADMDTEHLKGVDTSTKRALQRSLCKVSQEQAELKRWIDVGAQQSAPDSKKFSKASALIETAIDEVGTNTVVQLFERAKQQSNPSTYVIETLQDWVPKPHGFTGIPMSEQGRIGLSKIPEEITKSDEWISLIHARGRIRPDRLSSIYSVLMGLVLQAQGLTIDEYTKRSNDIRIKNPHLGIKRVVQSPTVEAEFSQLKGWIEIKNSRVYLGPKAKKLLT